jgi:multidrug efflux pump subunit AcrA (membrane-fusion protein)
VVIANLSRMQMVVSVSESDIGSIHVGQPATVSVDALPTLEFAAKVTAISVLPTSSSGVVSYDVTLVLTQSSSELRAGMSASATIVTAQVAGAVTVESAAVSSRGTTSTVTIDDNGKMTVTPVIAGLVGTSATQIVAGLKPGQEVAIPITTTLATAAAGTGTGTLGGSGLGGGLGGAGAGAGGGGGLGRFLRGGG